MEGSVSCLLDCMNGRIGLLFIGLHEWKGRSCVYPTHPPSPTPPTGAAYSAHKEKYTAVPEAGPVVSGVLLGAVYYMLSE